MMTKEDYEKLNDYLNGCFQELEIHDSFLLRYIPALARLSDEYVFLVKHYDLQLYNEQNNLTFDEVYLLAREIVESIDPNYLNYYDELIKSGQLDFSYEGDYPDSQFCYSFKSGKKLININRCFNYTDVTTLIHEFMHYMNCRDSKFSNNRYLLTEAISIYFEEYAKKYLIEKGVPKEKLFLNERIFNTCRTASSFNLYSLILLAYEKFGNIDENTYQLLNSYILNIQKEDYEKKCRNALAFLQKETEKFEFKCKMQDKNFSENEFKKKLFKYLTHFLNCDYRYIMGTVIAYYALENSTLEKMTNLCNHINEYPYFKMDVFETLNSAGIDIQKINIKVIENVLNENNTKRKNI